MAGERGGGGATLLVLPGVNIDSSGGSGNGVAAEQGQGAGVSSGVGGGAGVMEM